jgi:wobble nucleotide-excising tRNase
MNLEKKVDKIEEAILIMKDLVLRHEERLDEHNQQMSDFYGALEESRKDFDFKINALINSEIRKEFAMTNLEKRIENIENK